MDSRLELLNDLPDDALLPAYWVRQLLEGQPDLNPATTASEDLTVEQVADRYGRSPATIRRWLKFGRLEGWKLERGWRIPASAIDNLRERNDWGRDREPAKVSVSRNRDLGSWRQEYQEGGPSNGEPIRENRTSHKKRGSR